jgi:hypothetical protein
MNRRCRCPMQDFAKGSVHGSYFCLYAIDEMLGVVLAELGHTRAECSLLAVHNAIIVKNGGFSFLRAQAP